MRFAALGTHLHRENTECTVHWRVDMLTEAEQINGCKEQETNCSLTLVERKNIGFEVVSVCDGGADTSS